MDKFPNCVPQEQVERQERNLDLLEGTEEQDPESPVLEVVGCRFKVSEPATSYPPAVEVNQ